ARAMKLFLAIFLWIAAGALAQQRPAATAAPPQARTQAEYSAYQSVMEQVSAAATEQAFDKFVAAYPQSELRGSLQRQLVDRFFKEANYDKALAWSRSLLKLEPENPVALVRSAQILAETTADDTPEREPRLKEAQANAQKLLNTIDQSLFLLFNPGTPAEQMQ